jgi:hypothetical protein
MEPLLKTGSRYLMLPWAGKLLNTIIRNRSANFFIFFHFDLVLGEKMALNTQICSLKAIFYFMRNKSLPEK